MRLVGGKYLVLGLALTSSCDNIRDLCLQLVSGQGLVEYQWRLVCLTSPGTVSTISTMSSHQVASMVAVLSSPCSLSTNLMLASVSYTSNDTPGKVTDTVKISIAHDIHFDESTVLKFDEQLSEESLVALAVTGVSKKLSLFTKLGSFEMLEQTLTNNDFVRRETLCSFVFSKPEHALHNSVVKIKLESSQNCEMQVTVRDYSQATLFMRFLKRFLPLDVVFTESG